MTQSPPRIGGQDVESWGDPEDPIVLLIGRPDALFGDWRRSVRALTEAGRHVLIAPPSIGRTIRRASFGAS